METVKQKVKIIRMSGLPVRIQDLEDYHSEFNRLYDRAERLCKKDMLRLQKKLLRVETVLQKLYPSIQEVDECTSLADWGKLMDEYGNIMVSRNRDTLEPLYIIVDINGVPGL